MEIIYSPYFFIGVPGAPREIIVGKNIYNFIFCESVSYVQLLIFEVGYLDLVHCRFSKLMGFDFYFIFDFNFCSCIFTFIIHSYTIVRWLDSCLCWIFKLKAGLRKGRTPSIKRYFYWYSTKPDVHSFYRNLFHKIFF